MRRNRDAVVGAALRGFRRASAVTWIRDLGCPASIARRRSGVHELSHGRQESERPVLRRGARATHDAAEGRSGWGRAARVGAVPRAGRGFSWIVGATPWRDASQEG